MLGPSNTLAHRDTAGNGERPVITVSYGQTFWHIRPKALPVAGPEKLKLLSVIGTQALTS